MPIFWRATATGVVSSALSVSKSQDTALAVHLTMGGWGGESVSGERLGEISDGSDGEGIRTVDFDRGSVLSDGLDGEEGRTMDTSDVASSVASGSGAGGDIVDVQSDEVSGDASGPVVEAEDLTVVSQNVTSALRYMESLVLMSCNVLATQETRLSKEAAKNFKRSVRRQT